MRMRGGRTILGGIAACIAPQVGPLALNANGDAARFDDFGLPVLPDVMPGNAGPLAGVLPGLEWASARGCSCLAAIPPDAPFLPPALIGRVGDAVASAGKIGGASWRGRV